MVVTIRHEGERILAHAVLITPGKAGLAQGRDARADKTGGAIKAAITAGYRRANWFTGDGAAESFLGGGFQTNK